MKTVKLNVAFVLEACIVLGIVFIIGAIIWFAVTADSSVGSRESCRSDWYVDTGYKMTYGEWQKTHPGVQSDRP